MRNADEKAVAVLRGSRRPDAEQEKRFAEFLLRTYGCEIPLTFEEDKMLNGFTLTVGTDVYDWSLKSRLRQFEEKLKALKSGSDSVIPLMKEAVEDFTPSAEAEETGTVLTVGDEIAVVSGLEHAAYGEILLFSSGVKGMVQDLRRNEIGCVLFGDDAEITEGSLVRRSGKTAGIPATASSAVLSMHSARRSTARVTSAPRATAPLSAPHRASSTASRSTRLWKPAFSPSIPCSRLAAVSVSLSSATARPVKPPSRSIPF